jgi:hypothetical protein
VRKESGQGSQSGKGAGPSQAKGGNLRHGGREEKKCPSFGPPEGKKDDNGNWLRIVIK